MSLTDQERRAVAALIKSSRDLRKELGRRVSHDRAFPCKELLEAYDEALTDCDLAGLVP